MYIFNRFTISLLAFVLANLSAHAQISEGGFPPGLLTENELVFSRTPLPVEALPKPDLARVRAEDAQYPEQTRFAIPVPADISPAKNGVWTTAANGERVWRCQVQTPGALAQVLLFDVFRLPPGARFYAYSANKRRSLGAYTMQSCTPSGKFTIGPLPGEACILEYVAPAGSPDDAPIRLNRVDYAYDRGALADGDPASAFDFGQSLACHINVNCPEGANWQTEKKGVARILMVFSNGSGWCSGSMIANTAGTPEPYMLTAHHCQLIGLAPMFEQWVFHFDYEANGCVTPNAEPIFKSVIGCERVAYREETDFMLLKISPLPSNFGVYFNGWTRLTTPPANSTYIHHPVGDIKKISRDNDAATVFAQTLSWGGIFGVSPANTHWRTITDAGTYQPGSSGSPLFDPNKRIVGQLHGGVVNNANPCIVEGAYFGMFNLSWNQGSSSAQRLSDWLDPANTNNMTQNGYAQPLVSNVSINGNVQTHWGLPMPNVKIYLSGGKTDSALTDATGNYSFKNVPIGFNYNISPQHDINDINGVTTADLIAVSQHQLGSVLLDSPWKILAADANASNSLSAFDLVESRKVILGISPKYPSTTSWRFLMAGTTFATPSNPFGANLFSIIPINNLQQDANNINFKAFKTGDVNNSADPGQ